MRFIEAGDGPGLDVLVPNSRTDFAVPGRLAKPRSADALALFVSTLLNGGRKNKPVLIADAGTTWRFPRCLGLAQKTKARLLRNYAFREQER